MQRTDENAIGTERCSVVGARYRQDRRERKKVIVKNSKSHYQALPSDRKRAAAGR